MARAKGLPVIHRKLTADQKRRGVIFSSQLLKIVNHYDTDLKGHGKVHEVKGNDPNAQGKIANLKDTTFFAQDSQYRFNIIRT